MYHSLNITRVENANVKCNYTEVVCYKEYFVLKILCIYNLLISAIR